MGKPHALALALLGLLLALGWFLAQWALDPDRRTATVESEAAVEAEPRSGVVGGPASPEPLREPREGTRIGDDVVYHPRDVEIFREVMESARAERLDTLPLGDIMVRIGRRFVGSKYTPQLLEIPGDERVVINLREFDCVTYVESVLALARLVRTGSDDFGVFAEEIRRIRYRGGELDGYVSRLHYFSEWISDNERKGLLEDITPALGGGVYDERIDFMSSNAGAYPKLDGRPERVEEIREIERALSGRTRYRIPEDRIAAVADRIRDGDVIAATSNIEGLDIAHTGLAIRIDGRLHLMHAPLVGRSVEISDRPLADRIRSIEGQDGIMVARPR